MCVYFHLGVSKNSGTPKSSILIGFSIINHPFWGAPYFWKHPFVDKKQLKDKNILERRVAHFPPPTQEVSAARGVTPWCHAENGGGGEPDGMGVGTCGIPKKDVFEWETWRFHEVIPFWATLVWNGNLFYLPIFGTGELNYLALLLSLDFADGGF